MNEEVTGKQHEVAVLDEIGIEMKEKQVSAIKRELDHFTKTLKEKKDDLEDALEAQAVDLKVYELVLEGDNYKKVKPDFRYEELEEYWELNKQQKKVQQKSFLKRSEQAISKLRNDMKAVEEQKASCENKLTELGAPQ